MSDILPLKSMIEEADSRIIPHLNWSLSKGYKSFVILSNDADVLVLILHYLKRFKSLGVEQIWIQMGAGPHKRLIPIRHLYRRMPRPLTDVILAAHVDTGCDAISRVGTKLAALNAIPEIYLKGFGSKELDEEQIRDCEAYLVKVLRMTFNALRAEEYGKKRVDL